MPPLTCHLPIKLRSHVMREIWFKLEQVLDELLGEVWLGIL